MKVIQIIPELDVAGAEIMCENLTYGLSALGVEVMVISFYDKKTPITDRLEQKGIRIIYLHKKQGFDISLYRKLSKIFKQEKPDVVHTHRYVMPYVIPVACINHISVKVHTVHSIATKEQGKKLRVLAKIFYNRFGVCPVALSPEVQKTISD